MGDAKLRSGVSSDTTTASSLTEILDAHARMEIQCGEIYVQFAAAFRTPGAKANVDRNGVGGGRTRGNGARGQ
jgi:hypothetical protein